jgi:uncharacterized protein (TIGR02246 family)
MNADETAVAAVLKKYENALNASDAEAALKLYAPDGVFMPQHSPSSVGTAAVRKAYDAVFAAITLTVQFNIAEIRQIAPDWVLARTNSAGRTRNNRRASRARRRTRSSSCSRRSAAIGRLRAIAFARQTRRVLESDLASTGRPTG